MVQFLSIIFFSWISSIFVGFFKSSRFFCVILYYQNTHTFFPVVFLEQSVLEESEKLLATPGVLLLTSLDAKNEEQMEPLSTRQDKR